MTPDEGDETPKAGASAKASPPPSSLPPSPPVFTAPEKLPPKKGPGKKTKKLGNNQYTKNRDLAHHNLISSPHSKKRQLANTHGISSGDEPMLNGETHPTNTSNSTNKNSPGRENGVTIKAVSKFGKGKNKATNGHPVALSPQDMSIADMKRHMDAMKLYMQRAQAEYGEPLTPDGTGEKPFEQMSSMEMIAPIEKSIDNWCARFADRAAV